MTPRRISSDESCRILFAAPRSLKLPMGWKLSALRKISFPVPRPAMPSNGARTSGVCTMTLAMRAAAAVRGEPRLVGCDLFVTLEPCPMCAQAASLFRMRRIIFAAYDPKGGGVDHGARVLEASSCHHRPEVVGGVREEEAALLLRQFFSVRR